MRRRFPTLFVALLLAAAPSLAADQASTPQVVANARPATAAVTSVSAATSSTSILSSNTARRGASVFNDSTADCFLKFGTSASTTSFTVKIGPGGYFELPQPNYTGALTAVWASATGSARVTEVSP